MIYATLKFDFAGDYWVAAFDDNPRITGCGDTPQEAVDNLHKQSHKHDLWPNGIRPDGSVRD